MVAVNKHKVVGPYVFNILGLDEDLTPDTANDYLATYDASAGRNKKAAKNKYFALPQYGSRRLGDYVS